MNKLICNLKNAPIQKTLYGGKIKAPNKAQSFDLVKILRENGDMVDIITYRTKVEKGSIGDILRRYIVEKSEKGLKIIERNYKKLKDVFIDNPENPLLNDSLKVTGRRITSLTKMNDEYIEKSEETQTLTHRKNKSNVLHIKKILNKIFVPQLFEDETQSLYEYRKDAPRKGYTVHINLKNKMGFNLDVFNANYNFKGFSDDLIRKFKNDPYFLLHLYSEKDFKKIAPTIANHPTHKLIFEPKIRWYKGNDVRGYWAHEDTVNLNKNKLTSKMKIINTAAHEKEHSYQEEQCILISILKNEECNLTPISKERFEKYKKYVKDGGKFELQPTMIIDKYWYDIQNYITHEKDLKKHLDQTIERHARIAGSLAAREYSTSSKNLKEEFLFAPDYLMGASIQDYIDMCIGE